MPKPEIRFTKEMKPKERAAVLQKMEDWCKTSEVSDMKRSVLLLFIAYAKDHFIDRINETDTNLRDLEICNDVFQNADLSDVLFMRYAMSQTIYANSNLLREVIPKATDCYNTLLIPLTYQTRGAASLLGLFSLLTQTKIGLVASVLLFVFGDKIQELRISSSLQNQLALRKIGGVIPKVEDGYDGVNQGVMGFAKSTYTYSMQFFKNNIMPVISKYASPQEVKESTPRQTL